MGERLTSNQNVAGSIPVTRTVYDAEVVEALACGASIKRVRVPSYTLWRNYD